MICPYCRSGMEPGSLQNAHRLRWAAAQREPQRIFDMIFADEDEVELPGSFENGSLVPAYLCRKCGKIIIDCNES
ncbi:MAG: PF20097 family protein [Clostridia bacterium]|nr:PF20097 family protein [Clostridia bacterium]